MWTLIVLTALGAEPASFRRAGPETARASACSSAPLRTPARTAQNAKWRCESTNFIVRSYLRNPQAAEAASRCEACCCELRKQLLGEQAPQVWIPKCEVVLHASRSSYLDAVGPGGAQTAGSSAVVVESGKIVQRRIDLLGDDQSAALAAMPHELVHVLLAELFPNSPPPRWAEEGLALRSDAADKQARHLRDLRYALDTGTALSLERLFGSASYPSGWERAVFYGQSLSVVEYLAQRDSPGQFVEFIRLCGQRGHDQALREAYGIQDVAELQRRWRQHVLGGG